MSMMKLILRADVDFLGRLGDIVTVKPGYGRNYLIPQGLAMSATESNLKVFGQERNKLQHKIDAIRFQAKSLAEKIEAVEVVIPVRVGEFDKLYGSVTRSTILDALTKVLGEAAEGLDRRMILLDDPIRSLGEHKTPIKLHPDVTVELTVKVVRHDLSGVGEVTPAVAETPAEAAAEADAAVESA